MTTETPAEVLAELVAKYPELAAAAQAVSKPRLLSRTFTAVESYFRTSGIGLVAVLAGVAVYFIAPQEGTVALWKLAMLAASLYGGYWACRQIFPYARPDSFLPFVPDPAKPNAVPGPFAGNPVVFVGAMAVRALLLGLTLIAVASAL